MRLILFSNHSWGFCGVLPGCVIKAPSGRQRFNVLGALDALTLQLITVTNDCYINALSVCQLLLKLRLLFPDDPLTVVLDNARYQRCRLVLDVAAALEIELLFLPPYSPNLNLIERLWKFVKKECLTTQYYAAFEAFKDAINSCLAHTQDIHKDKLTTLLTLNFQTFDNVIL
jgi:transposase